MLFMFFYCICSLIVFLQYSFLFLYCLFFSLKNKNSSTHNRSGAITLPYSLSKASSLYLDLANATNKHHIYKAGMCKLRGLLGTLTDLFCFAYKFIHCPLVLFISLTQSHSQWQHENRSYPSPETIW